MLMTDTITLDGARLTADGYLAAEARIARTGIQIYAGREVGKPEMAQARVWRPDSEVFDRAAMASFAHRPVTNDHPAKAVTADNWKEHARGMTGADVVRDGEFIRVPMVLMDKALIDAVAAGKRELSAGYHCDMKWEAGTTPEGEAYDAIQTNIRGNHLAVVTAARGGPALRIGDEKPKGERSMTDTRKTSLVVDGLTVELDVKDAEIVRRTIEKLTKDASDASAKLADAAAVISTKDGALAAKDAEIVTLKAAVADADATLDARITERASVIADAERITGAKIDPKGKTTAAIKAEAVKAKLGDAVNIADANAVSGAFAALSKSAVVDPVASALKGAPIITGDAMAQRDQAYAKHLSTISGAWKGASA